MNTENQNITLAKLLQSLEDNFNPQERARILEQLKNSQPTDEALLGAKILLEDSNWDYTVLKKAFETTTERIEQMASKPPELSFSYFKYAAVLLPLIFFLGYFITKTDKEKDAIDQYYPKEEGLPNFMSPEKTNWDHLMELYRANKMKEAFLVSERILVQKPLNDTAIYFNGVIAYQLKKFKIAQRGYSNISGCKESVFYYDGLLRLGFALKKQNEIKAAQLQFESIAKDSNNPYNQNAKEILNLFKE